MPSSDSHLPETAYRPSLLTRVLRGIACCSALATVLCSKAAIAEIKHSFLGVGKANKAVIVAEDGTVEWSFDMPASDGWVLPNGNVLLALYGTKGFPNGGVVEVDRETKTIVFEYKGQQKETSTVQPLPDGRYLVAELGPQPRALVLNRKGEVVQTTPFQCQTNNFHMQTRMLRLLPNGNLIAPHLFDFAVKEYEAGTGKVVRSFPTDDRGRAKRDWPFTAIRLKDGNTLIACTNGNRVIEVDAQGNIAWSVSNKDIGENLFDDACGAQRLPNGNTVISSYHASGDRVKLFEVTRDKKVVWRYSGMKHGFHHFQILTTNGKPLKENTWKECASMADGPDGRCVRERLLHGNACGTHRMHSGADS